VLLSCQFVTNVLFGKFILGKAVTRRMGLGTVMTVAGTVLTVLFSAKRVRH
jgi:drug/metabolite transporter (DMT)-like permease